MGVAIPSMLSCYGVIVFERWSFVVGEVSLSNVGNKLNLRNLLFYLGWIDWYFGNAFH